MNRIECKPFTVACIPAYNEEKTMGGVVVRAVKYVDRVVVHDDGSGDLTGEIAEGLGGTLLKRRRSGIISPIRVRGVRVNKVCRYPL